MRIVSKFHDYYDGVMRTAPGDKSFTFAREKFELKYEGAHLRNFEHIGPRLIYSFKYGLVGFCGKMYPFIYVTEKPGFTSGVSVWNYFYNWPALLNVYPGLNDIDSMDKKWLRSNIGTELKKWLTYGICRKYSWTSHYYEVTKDSGLKKLFYDHRIAYFIIQSGKIIDKGKNHIVFVHPCLEDFQFYKVIDTYTAFQKIEMFFTNEIVKLDEINIIIPDKLKAQSKGFNEMSFRKEKQKK